MKLTLISVFSILLLPSIVAAQLSGSVGPTTTTAKKAAKKVCNILNFGGVASKTSDIGPPLTSAWAACKAGGEVYIPTGDYGMNTWVTLSGGTGVSIRLDGVIYRVGTGAGNMILVQHTTDFEMFSSNAGGAIQGYGYAFHAVKTYGPRILRLYDVVDFSVHDLALVDSPAFHFTIDTCSNGEVYNMIMRGGNQGGLDGVDVWGTNIHIHDVEVTNKDECVTVKSPASHILVEQIYCNWSGGCAIGSLGANTDIHHVTYNHIYTQRSNQMLMIKSNGGSGSLYSCTFSNFIGHSNAYTLNLDSHWASLSTVAGSGVLYHDLIFSNWRGTTANGASRATIQMLCPAGAPCYGMSISNFYVWTETGSKVLYKLENAYGSGGGLRTGAAHTTYAITTQTVTTMPAASYTVAAMAADLTAGFPITASIPIPTVPVSYYPGLAPLKARL